MTGVDFFFSFRSPYSYLAAPRVFALGEHALVELAYRGVIPMVMRGQPVPRAKRIHTLRDAKREATRLGMPFGPVHDPVGPGALRCLAIGEHARDVGLERQFVLVASRAIWSKAADVARDRPLRRICEEAGLQWEACQDAFDDPRLRARFEESTDALLALGHWGVPVLSFDGQLFWGQDRVEDAARTLGITTAPA